LCVDEDASDFDLNLDGCVDDSDADSVKDDVDLCYTEIINSSWPVMENGCRPIDDAPQITIISELENGSVWEDVLLVRWLAEDNDGDQLTTGVKIMIIHNDSNESSLELVRCVPRMRGGDSNEFFCIWVIPIDLPSYDINGQRLHLEFFVQSSNQSPEANNELITKSSQKVFTSSWDNSSIDDDNSLTLNKEEIAKQKRFLALAIIGLIGSLIGALVAAKKFLRSDFDEGFSDIVEGEQPPIESDGY
jgi:hypothetical protein